MAKAPKIEITVEKTTATTRAKKAIKWFKRSFEDDNGKPDANALTVFGLVSTIIIIATASLFQQVDHSVLISLEGMAGAILTAKNFKEYKSNSNKHDNRKETAQD